MFLVILEEQIWPFKQVTDSMPYSVLFDLHGLEGQTQGTT
jgi:hypothetical protein